MNTIAPIKTFEYDRPVGGVCSTAEAWARTPTPLEIAEKTALKTASASS
jgi:quinolinate synthase